MSGLRLEIRPAAREEFDEAADWYRYQDPLIRNRFVASVRKALTAIRLRPLTFPIAFGTSVRRAVVARFPYSVFSRSTTD